MTLLHREDLYITTELIELSPDGKPHSLTSTWQANYFIRKWCLFLCHSKGCARGEFKSLGLLHHLTLCVRTERVLRESLIQRLYFNPSFLPSFLPYPLPSTQSSFLLFFPPWGTAKKEKPEKFADLLIM